MDTTVTLNSSNPAAVGVTDSVVIQSGYTSAPVPVTLTAEGTATITGTLGTSIESTKEKVLSAPSVSSVFVSGRLLAGSASNLSVGVNVAPSSDTSVSLSSSNPAVVTVPSSVTIAAGTTSASSVPLSAGVVGSAVIRATLG